MRVSGGQEQSELPARLRGVAGRDLCSRRACLCLILDCIALTAEDRLQRIARSGGWDSPPCAHWEEEGRNARHPGRTARNIFWTEDCKPKRLGADLEVSGEMAGHMDSAAAEDLAVD